MADRAPIYRKKVADKDDDDTQVAEAGDRRKFDGVMHESLGTQKGQLLHKNKSDWTHITKDKDGNPEFWRPVQDEDEPNA